MCDKIVFAMSGMSGYTESNKTSIVDTLVRFVFNERAIENVLPTRVRSMVCKNHTLHTLKLCFPQLWEAWF